VTDGFPLPRLFRAGVSYDLLSNEDTRFTLLSEFVESNNTEPAFGFGGEFEWASSVSPIGASLRGSYSTQPDNVDLGGLTAENSNLDGLGVGGGIFYRIADQYRVKVDYAYRHYGTLGSVDVFSVTFGWD
jgi:opacity protein-like surface antigen